MRNGLNKWFPLTLLVLAVNWTASAQEAGSNGCLTCHESRQNGFAPGHGFAPTDCVACHQGDPRGRTLPLAHAGLVVFPGQLDNAARTCGRCHADKVRSVTRGFMANGKGMAGVTRYAFAERASPEGEAPLSDLGHSPADSLLRKLCAGCHLGQPKPRAGPLDTRERGGGCLACHINDRPTEGHVPLTRKVQDSRCFGCHARSGRIALNYTGLAEVDDDAVRRPPERSLARLQDGRLVERRQSDTHHRAGMACIDCHTGPGLMGHSEGMHHHEEAVDIACEDCHANPRPLTGAVDRPEGTTRLPGEMPFPVDAGSRFPVTARGTPLWHVEVRRDGVFLHSRLGGAVLAVPQLRGGHPDPRHARLSCDACHAAWAPQCYGCHLEYDPEGSQWDHLEHRVTPGRWHQERWNVRNGAPPLGIDATGRIKPFVPGMVMTVDHPEHTGFQRLFAALSPHTTGNPRSCGDCHRSSTALGLGSGTLVLDGSQWRFTPAESSLADGLPADAWTDLTGTLGGTGTRSGERPFNGVEILRILNAPVEGH